MDSGSQEALAPRESGASSGFGQGSQGPAINGASFKLNKISAGVRESVIISATRSFEVPGTPLKYGCTSLVEHLVRPSGLSNE